MVKLIIFIVANRFATVFVFRTETHFEKLTSNCFIKTLWGSAAVKGNELGELCD